MQKPRIILAALAAIIAVATASAGEKFDPAARAKAVAPFVSPETVAIVHIDLSRVSLAPLAEFFTQRFPEAVTELRLDRRELVGTIDRIVQQGVRDFHLVIPLPSARSRSSVRLIAVGAKGDARSMAAEVIACDLQQKGIQAAARRIEDVLVLAKEPRMLEPPSAIESEDRPELAAAFEAAGDTAIQVVIVPPKHFAKVVEEMLPELPKEIGGGPSTIVTHGALWTAIGINVPPSASVKVVVQSQDAPAAAELAKKIDDIVRSVAGLPQAKELGLQIGQLLPKPLFAVEKDRLGLAIDEATGKSILAGLQRPLERARQAARRTQSLNHLKQISLAMNNYHFANNCFPPAARCDKQGKPLLSWRVLILPYLEQQSLYEQFHLDESWDSPHNKALIAKIPDIYRSPNSKLVGRTLTNYVVPVGPGAAFDGPKCIGIQDVRDGTSNTIMTLEADDAVAVVWTRPDDLPFDPKEPFKGLGHMVEGGFLAGYMDGSARFVPNKITPETMKALVTPNGGEVVNRP